MTPASGAGRIGRRPDRAPPLLPRPEQRPAAPRATTASTQHPGHPPLAAQQGNARRRRHRPYVLPLLTDQSPRKQEKLLLTPLATPRHGPGATQAGVAPQQPPNGCLKGLTRAALLLLCQRRHLELVLVPLGLQLLALRLPLLVCRPLVLQAGVARVWCLPWGRAGGQVQSAPTPRGG